MDKISVIVPAYNAEKTIGKCLETLVNQTHQNMEIITIDDGSKDNTLKIMKEYQKKYPEKVIIISRENKGIGYTRNEGIKKATGKYIGFIDSDDYVELEMYEHLLKHMKKTKSDIVVCDYYQFDAKKRVERTVANFETTNLLESPNLINDINTAPWNKLYKKEIFDDIEYPENLKYEDLSTVLFALLKANKISKLNEPLVDYYINMSGETQTYNYRVFDLYKLLEMIFDKFPKNKEMKNELLKLSWGKVFPYIIDMYETKDRELMLRYLDYGIGFLDKHFKGWRIKYISKSKNVKDFFRRILQSNKFLYKPFIKKRVPKTKKKILFTSYNLCIGGIEKALVNMVNNIDFSKYDVTLLLQHKEGDFLKEVDQRVEVLGYNLSKMKFVLLRKAINLTKIIFTILKNRNKYDFAACFGTWYKASAAVALYASKNNVVWMHTNILQLIKNHIKNNEEKYDLYYESKKFLKNLLFRKFKNYLFVSNNAIESYLKLYPEDKDKCSLCYNFVDYKKIIELSKEKISYNKIKNRINIVNISRHTEYDKKISRIIKAVSQLKNKYKITLFLIGDGADHKKYIELVKEYKLENEVKFLGSQKNPFPYYLLGDVFVLSSAFEGFPTVYTEALTLDIPIVTTDVSDAQTFIQNKYGIVCKNDDDSLTEALEKMIKMDFKMKQKFDPEKFNKQSMDTIERLINND